MPNTTPYDAQIAAPGVPRQTVVVLDDRAPSPWSDDPGRWMRVRTKDGRELVLPFTYLERVLQPLCPECGQGTDGAASIPLPSGGRVHVAHASPEQRAYDLGREHAQNAASWIIDGNTDRAQIPAVLALMDDGDPRADDYLPRRPDLSGEWAGGPTPLSLARDITGEDDPDAALIDALANAYEHGVSDTFEPACQAVLRAAL